MTTHVHLVLTAPAAGGEDAYEAWSERRLDEAVAIDGVRAAQRYRFVPQRDGDAPLRADFALYELETDDLAALHARLRALADDPAVDGEQTLAWSYEEIAPHRTDGDDRPTTNPHLFVVLTAPTAGLEDEFDDWYTNRHLGDVLKLTDYRSAQRFRFVDVPGGDAPFRPYLALYDTDTTDVPATQRRLMEVVATPAMPFSPGIDRSQSVGWYYRPVGERRTA